MRALLQRVHRAEVEVDRQVVSAIDAGLLVYLGVAGEDEPDHAAALAEKVARLRIFEDDDGKMNLSLLDLSGPILVVPNFTLQADARKGRRPAFVGAARPEQAEPLYQRFCQRLRELGLAVGQGVFRAEMSIRSEAAGPVNLVVDIPPAP